MVVKPISVHPMRQALFIDDARGALVRACKPCTYTNQAADRYTQTERLPETFPFPIPGRLPAEIQHLAFALNRRHLRGALDELVLEAHACGRLGLEADDPGGRRIAPLQSQLIFGPGSGPARRRAASQRRQGIHHQRIYGGRAGAGASHLELPQACYRSPAFREPRQTFLHQDFRAFFARSTEKGYAAT